MTDTIGLKSHFDRPLSEAGSRNSGYAQRRDFLGDLTDAVRDNPLPAALIGMGILWMFTGGGKTSLGEAMTSRAPGSVAGSLARGAGKVGRSMLHGAEALGSSMADVAQSSVEAVSEAAGRVGHALTPSSTHESNEGYGSYSSKGYEWEEENDHSDYDMGTSRSFQSGLQQKLSEFLDQQPLVLGAAGLALGAGIAASLPMSGPESQAFGKISDDLRHKVSDAMTQVKDIAAAAVDEAGAQGISTKAVRDGLSGVANKL